MAGKFCSEAGTCTTEPSIYCFEGKAFRNSHDETKSCPLGEKRSPLQSLESLKRFTFRCKVARWNMRGGHPHGFPSTFQSLCSPGQRRRGSLTLPLAGSRCPSPRAARILWYAARAAFEDTVGQLERDIMLIQRDPLASKMGGSLGKDGAMSTRNVTTVKKTSSYDDSIDLQHGHLQVPQQMDGFPIIRFPRHRIKAKVGCGHRGSRCLALVGS